MSNLYWLAEINLCVGIALFGSLGTQHFHRAPNDAHNPDTFCR